MITKAVIAHCLKITISALNFGILKAKIKN